MFFAPRCFADIHYFVCSLGAGVGADEDRWAHVAWGFMAIYHVAASAEFADSGLNTLVDMEAVRANNAAAAAAAATQAEEAEQAAEQTNAAAAAAAST